MRPHSVVLLPSLFLCRLLTFLVLSVMVVPNTVLADTMAEGQRKRDIPSWASIPWRDRLAAAQVPVIDGDLTDLRNYVQELEAAGGGCGLEVADPDSDIVLTQPFQPCSPIVPINGGQYFTNGFDQDLALIAFDGNDLYLGIQTVGIAGDPDGNGNPDTDCDTNILDSPGIGQFESYKWFIDVDCNGSPDIVVTLNNNQVQVTGTTHSGTNFAFTGHGVEVLVQGVDLIPQFTARTFAGSDVDGLSEDLSQELECPPLIPTVFMTKSVEDVCAGSTTVVSINVQNTGAVPLGAVVITDQLPAGFTFAGNVTGIGEPNVSNGTVTFPGIALEPSESRVVTFAIQAPAECSGLHTNSATVRGVFTHPCNPEPNNEREALNEATAQFSCFQLQVTVEDGAACAGSTDELCAVVTGGTGPYTYSWTGPGGFTSGLECITVGEGGTYTVTVTDAQGCSGTASGQLTITPSPTCQIEGPNAVCAESEGHVYTATVNPADGSVTYNWSVSGNGTISGSNTGSSVTVNAGAAGSYTVNLSVMRDGCPGSCNYPVTVNPAPTCEISGPDPVCAGSEGNVYTSSVNPAGGSVTYAWSISGNGTISGSTSGSSVNVDAGAAGSYTLTLSITRDNCLGSCSKTVTVNANPTCEIAGPDPVCALSEGHLYTAAVSPAGGSVTYAWSVSGNGSISGSTSGSSVTVDAGAAGSYTLTLDITRDNCPGSCSKTVTVNPNPTCEITGPNPVCEGETEAVYTSSVSPAGGSVSYNWSVAGGGVIIGPNNGSSVVVDPTGAGSFTLNLTVTRDGCQGTCSYPVTVNPGPTCVIEGPVSVCAESDGHVYTASVNPPGGAVIYSWSVTGNGTISGSSSGSSVTVNAGSAGSYTVNLSVTRDGCVGTCSLPVTVNANPTCEITGPSPVCAESQGNVYSASVNPAGGSVTYAWSVTGNGTISGSSSGSSVTVDAGGAGSYTVNLNVTRDGCEGSCSLPVTVDANPTCEITGPNPVCALSEGLAYAATVSPAGGSVTYNWSVTGNGTLSGSNTGSSIMVNAGAAGNFTVNLSVMRNGCPGSCSYPVTVNASPTCEISGPSPVCAQSTGHVYTASVNPAGGSVTYNWSVTGNGTISGSSSGSSVTVDAGAAGSYTVNLTVTRDGCVGSCSLPVTVSPGLEVSVQGMEVCAGATAELCAVVTGGTAPYTYSWTGPGGFTSNQECITVGADGTYNVTVTDTPGCSGSASGELNVLPPVVVTVENVVTCEGVPVQLCAVLPQPRPEPVNYNWTGPGGFQGTGQCVMVTVPGVYTVQVTDGQGCQGTTTATVTVETPDVEITKSAAPTQTEDNSTVTIVVENTGASALSPVQVTDLLPPGLSFESGTLQSDCSVTATTESNGSGTRVTFSNFDLEPGEICTITYTMACLEFDNEARIDTADVIAWCEGVDSEDPENLDLAVTDSDTARVVCESPFFACPHTIGFWRQQCEQQGNGSTKVCLEGMYDLWATVLSETGVLNWATSKGQPNQSTADILAMSDEDRFDALCTQLQGPRPMTNRDMAEVQYLGLMLNVASGALPLDVPLSGSGGFSGTAAEAIAGIENAINNGGDVAYWAGVADAINNNIGIEAEDCEEDIFRNQPACTGDAADNTVDSREVWLSLYPNPVFTNETMIKYGVPEAMQGLPVQIQVFDISGRLVRTLSGAHGSAVQQSVWDLRDDAGSQVRSGVYFYRLRVGKTEKVERLMVIR